MMNNTELQSIISGWFEGITFESEGKQYLTAYVPKELLRDLMWKLKNDPQTSFDFLFCLSGVDYLPTNFAVFYHLESTKFRHIMVIVAKTEDRDEKNNLETVSDIFPTAIFHEREAYDLMGIRFDGHPDLRRLFLTDNWIGYPLRKDYVDEANLIIK